MKQLIQSLEGLDMIVKIILAIPALDIIWGIYRICCALEEKDTSALVIAIVLLFIPFMWVVDILAILMKGNVWRYSSAK